MISVYPTTKELAMFSRDDFKGMQPASFTLPGGRVFKMVFVTRLAANHFEFIYGCQTFSCEYKHVETLYQ
jgi:hypothetical protein